jgi:hypothetical protein
VRSSLTQQVHGPIYLRKRTCHDIWTRTAPDVEVVMPPGDHAWSDLPADAPVTRSFTLEEVRRLQADAVRLCDGYEYRHHRNGTFTFFFMRHEAEVVLTDVVILPEDQWWHLPGCDCPACRGTG